MIHNKNSIGNLYIISTPIGNLEDITYRAIRILKEVDSILCEDKRVTIKLLNKYDINTKMIPYHKFNESESVNKILELIKEGKNIALVSDAGTPILSDPGSIIVKECLKNQIKVIPIPGPSAITASLSVSGFNINDFLFIGFLPDKKNERIKLLSELKNRSNYVVIFMAPHDLNKYTNEIAEIYPDIEVFYIREITKMFENSYKGPIKDFKKYIETSTVKGEMVLILDFSNLKVERTNINFNNEIEKQVKNGLSLKEASKLISKEHNVSSKMIYDAYIKKH